MADKLIQSETLQGIANAIRTKDGTSASIQVSDFAERINDIPSGIDVNDFVNGTEPRGDVVLTLTTGMRAYILSYTTNMTSCYAPNYIGAFSNSCLYSNGIQFVKISFPLATSSSSSGLRANRGLRVADIGLTTLIAQNFFDDDRVLTKVILRKSNGIATLSNVNAFTNTPFRNYDGKSGVVYCPNSLISTYTGATNWANLTATSFRAIENTRYENVKWFESCNSTCTLDGTTIDVLDTETVAMFKTTEGVSTLYENGTEVTDTTSLVKGRTFTTSI